MKIEAYSVMQNGLQPFLVSGGPFNGDQIMGWHITGEGGGTLGVSPDSRFVEAIQQGQRLIELLKKAHAYNKLSKLHDEGYLDDLPRAKWEELSALMKTLKIT